MMEVSGVADEERIAEIVRGAGNLPSIAVDEDIYNAGLSSIKALQLLTELEAQFDVTLPDDEFVRARTVTALNQLIQSVRVS